MNVSSALFTTSILVSGLCAQTATYRTLTPLGAYAEQGVLRSFKAVPANTTIPPNTQFGTTASVGGTFLSAAGSWGQGNSIHAALLEQGGASVYPNQPPASAGTTPSPTAPHTPGPHATLLSVRARAGSFVRIRMWSGGGGGSPLPARLGTNSIDIGNDGRVEFSTPSIGNFNDAMTVQVPASGILPIKLQSAIKFTQTGPGSFVFKSTVSVLVDPAPSCVGIPFGRGCGPSLSGWASASGNDFLFDLTFAAGTPRSPGLLVAGAQRINVPIPGLQCNLLVNPVMVLGFQTDVNGARAWRFRFPSGPLDLSLQAADLAGRARASNGLQVLCTR